MGVWSATERCLEGQRRGQGCETLKDLERECGDAANVVLKARKRSPHGQGKKSEGQRSQVWGARVRSLEGQRRQS